MAKKKVIISFDYDHDKHYKYLLEAWDANDDFEFSFADNTPEEINTDNVGRVKAGLTQKINEASYTLVIIGKYANTKHKNSNLIGEINWINWEIKKSIEAKNKLVAIKIDKSNDSPVALLGQTASWAMSFTEESILKALRDA
jgi:hypothetical protein